MAIRNIVLEGDPVLRKKSFEVTDFGKKTHELLDDMYETMKKAEGAGLAAVQVGVLRRIFIIETEEDGYFEFINPVIFYQKGMQTDNEACLSVKNLCGTVKRPMKVKIKAFDRNGEEFIMQASGFLARAICHEYDHLDGVLYIDKATNLYTPKEK